VKHRDLYKVTHICITLPRLLFFSGESQRQWAVWYCSYKKGKSKNRLRCICTKNLVQGPKLINTQGDNLFRPYKWMLMEW
jgi:hypothetical protein